MPYNDELADRVRFALRERDGISEKKMFGGICFLIKGKMLAGVTKDDLMVRVGADNHDRLLEEKGARLMDFTGRPMKGYL
jgi:TfoX/Sxy family transcriptional regulator of competence genes